MIIYTPGKILKQIASEKKIAKLVKGDLTLNKAVLSLFDDVDFIQKKRVSEVALKTIRQYKKRFKEERKAGLGVNAAKEEALAGKKLLINRVQNEIVKQTSDLIEEKYYGESYEWLPSGAEEPDPEHQLNYGEIFLVGDGEMPGQRYGCQCGMRILVKETKLNL